MPKNYYSMCFDKRLGSIRMNRNKISENEECNKNICGSLFEKQTLRKENKTRINSIYAVLLEISGSNSR